MGCRLYANGMMSHKKFISLYYSEKTPILSGSLAHFDLLCTTYTSSILDGKANKKIMNAMHSFYHQAMPDGSHYAQAASRYMGKMISLLKRFRSKTRIEVYNLRIFSEYSSGIEKGGPYYAPPFILNASRRHPISLSAMLI